ncbi:MAG: TolC family protein [Polyangiaceae bacterium]
MSIAACALSLAGCAIPVRSTSRDEALRLYHAEPRIEAGSAPASPEGAALPIPEQLTVDDAIALAKERSAKLVELRARADQAKAEVGVAARLPNPEVQVQNLRMDQVLDGKPRERTTVKMPLPRPGEIDARIAAAQADEASATAALHAAEMDIEGDVRWLFDDVLLLDAQIKAADAVVAARDAVAAQMKARLDAQQATALDETLAAVTAAEAVEDRVSLASQRAATRAALFVQLGLSADANIKIVGAPPEAWPPAPLPTERALIEQALQRRPEVESAIAKMDAADARTYAEKVKRWPWLTFVELGYEIGPTVKDGQGFTFQAGVELPIFNTNQKGVAAAEAEQKAAKANLANAVQTISREIRIRLQSARIAEQQVDDLRSRVLPASARAGVEIQKALSGHDVDVVLALMVDVRRVRVELLYLDAIRRYRAAVSDLRRSVGGNLPGAK